MQSKYGFGPGKVVVSRSDDGRFYVEATDEDENTLGYGLEFPGRFYQRSPQSINGFKEFLREQFEKEGLLGEFDDFDESFELLLGALQEDSSDLEKSGKKKPKKKPKKGSVPDMEEEWLKGEARSQLRDPGLLDSVRRTLFRGFYWNDNYCFILGEPKKKLFTYLTFISARTPYPQFEWVTGDPGSGKTNLLSTTSKLFPGGYVRERGYVTGAGLRYAEHEDYEVLYVQEFRGQEEQDIRLISTEDQGFQVEIAKRDEETGEMTTEIHEVPAKVFVTTSAEELPTDQLMRRVWLISMDESPELTRRVNERIALEAEGEIEACDDEWIQILRRVPAQVEKRDVEIPFAREILDITDWDRTNFKRFLQLLRIITCLHQEQRDENGSGKLVSDLRDLYMAFRIADEILPRTLMNLPNRLEETLEVLQQDGEEGGEGLTSAELAEEIGKAQSTVRRYANDLVSMGFAYKTREGRENVYTPAKEGGETRISWIHALDWSKCEEKVAEAVDGTRSLAGNPEKGYPMVDPLTGEKGVMYPSEGSIVFERVENGDEDPSEWETTGEKTRISENHVLSGSIYGEEGEESETPDEKPERPEGEEEPEPLFEKPEEEEPDHLCEECREKMGVEDKPAVGKFPMGGRERWLCRECAREAGFVA